MQWEMIDNYHSRARVPGGWLVKAIEDVVHEREYHGLVPGWDYRVAMAFVPDPNHEWELAPQPADGDRRQDPLATIPDPDVDRLEFDNVSTW